MLNLLIHGHVVGLRYPAYVVGVVLVAIGKLGRAPTPYRLTHVGLRGHEHREE